MSINSADPQISDAPTHVYLLQMNSGVNSSSEQSLPLHLLENNIDYNRQQYLLSIPTNCKQKQGQDQLLFIDSCNPGKILGLLVDKNYQEIESQLSVPNIQPQALSNSECSNAAVVSLERSTQHIVESQSNAKPNPEICSHGIQNYVHISDRIVPPRALAVLPNVLQVQRRQIIATRRKLPTHARFGPVQGIKRKISHPEAVELVLDATSNKKPLFLVKSDENVITHIETSDKDKSNWISLLPLGDENTANVWLYEENKEIYGITTESIPLRKPLMLGYSKKYADDYGLIGPIKDIDKESSVQKPWWCYECQKALPSANLLQRHMDLCHKEEKQLSRRRYRCGHCSYTFARLFTLRRHMSRYCLNKVDKKNNVISSTPPCTTVTEPQINTSATIYSEDNRIPSDESFQNYSNGLDFSTNLFDTDRIPSLDISGNSRSDNDFNPYNIGFRDESGFPNDLVPSNKVENTQKSSKEKPQKCNEQLLVTCPYCYQIIVKEKRRQHVSECPGRRFECECKKIFTNKKQFAEHMHSQHSSQNTTSNQKEEKDNSSLGNTNPQNLVIYKCDQCDHSFKRRGMLVNHLWQIHKTVSAKVPLERRVRHYPCVICPKIYRTAAKRDRHVLVHHPGAEKLDRKVLDGGTRVCEPAMCSACPRQYVTRAKLLQHQRREHPYLVPRPVSKTPIN